MFNWLYSAEWIVPEISAVAPPQYRASHFSCCGYLPWTVGSHYTGCQLFYLLFQFLDLTATAEKIAVVLKSSTGHRTAWTQGFSLQRYHTDTVPVFSGNGNSMIDMIHHQHSAKKISDQTVIFLLCSYQPLARPIAPGSFNAPL